MENPIVVKPLRGELDEAIENGNENNLKKIFTKIVLNAIELKIVTTVSSIEEGSNNAANTIETKINIIEGDITNTFGKNFLGQGSYAELREFHKGQVEFGLSIIKNNIESVKEILKSIEGYFQAKKPDSEDTPKS